MAAEGAHPLLGAMDNSCMTLEYDHSACVEMRERGLENNRGLSILIGAGDADDFEVSGDVPKN